MELKVVISPLITLTDRLPLTVKMALSNSQDVFFSCSLCNHAPMLPEFLHLVAFIAFVFIFPEAPGTGGVPRLKVRFQVRRGANIRRHSWRCEVSRLCSLIKHDLAYLQRRNWVFCRFCKLVSQISADLTSLSDRPTLR